MDLLTITLIAFVVFLTGISKSAFAGALGVFAVPLLMLQLPATNAIALMLPVLIIADILSVKSYWKQWDTNLLRSLIPGAAVGIIIAHAVVSYVSVAGLKTIIAIICILFSLRALLLSSTKIAMLNNRAGSLLMSGLSGFSSTLVHAGGPPLMIYLTSIGLSPRTFIGTAAAFYATMNLIKLIGFSSIGILSLSDISIALLFVPVALLGNWFGLKIQSKLSTQVFLRAMNVLLLILGCWYIGNVSLAEIV